MLRSSFYLLTILAICTAALADCLRFVRGRRGGGRRVVEHRLRLLRPWLAGWLGFQGIFGAALVGTGNGERALAFFVWFGAATLLLPFLLCAGAVWTAAAGFPLFPLLATWSRGRGRHRDRWRWNRRRTVELALLAFLPLLGTALLFAVVPWRPAVSLETSLRPEQHGPVANGLFLLYVLVSAAVVEEVIFRHYLLGRLAALVPGPVRGAGWRLWPAVVLTTALWTLGHGSMVEPAWMKETQIALYGVALGVAQIRHGLEACLLLHLLFNGAALVLGGWLAPTP